MGLTSESTHLPKVDMVIAQQLRALSVYGVNYVTVEKVSRYKTCKDFRNQFRIITALREPRQKLVLMKAVNTFDVGKNSMFLSSKCLWNFFSIEYRHVVCDADFERFDVILFILQKLPNNVQQFR